MITVRVQDEVVEYLRRLAPLPRRVITCVFAGPRKWIYEVFQSRLLE
jgi:hypothetical protein